MKCNAFLILLTAFYAQFTLAEPALLAKVDYTHQKFEVKCMIRAAIEPPHQPLCPRISKYTFEPAISLDAIKIFIQEKLSITLNEADFMHSKDVFIADLLRRQRETGVGIEFVKDYDPYLTKVYQTINSPVVWTSLNKDYLVLISKKDLTLFLVEGAGVQ